MSARFAILLRHGDYHQKPGTPSALQPFGLTANGKIQARDAGLGLAELAHANGWQLAPEIICSRLLRAYETAGLLKNALSEKTGADFSLREETELAERSVGILANLTIAEIELVLEQDMRTQVPPADWKSDSHYRLPVQGAESLLEAGERVARLLKAETLSLPGLPDANARIFVGHGAALRHAAHHLGVLAFDDIRRLSMHHARPVVLKLEGARWSHACGDWKERRVPEAAVD